MGHAQLFRGVHAAAWRLLAVAQGGIEEENLVLAAKDAEQATADESFAIGGKTHVMRFVADGGRTGQAHGAQHFAVARGALIEVDDRYKIRFDVRLVSGPHD